MYSFKNQYHLLATSGHVEKYFLQGPTAPSGNMFPHVLRWQSDDINGKTVHIWHVS